MSGSATVTSSPRFPCGLRLVAGLAAATRCPVYRAWPRAGTIPRSTAQGEIQDNAGGNGDQNVVAAGLNPVVAARGRAELVAAPIIDDVVAMAVFHRQAIAAMKVVIG